MKAYEISGSHGTFLQLEDGRYADTVIDDTSEPTDATTALQRLRTEADDYVDKPFYGWSAPQLTRYVGA